MRLDAAGVTGLLLDGAWAKDASRLAVLDKYTGQTVTEAQG